MRNWGTVVTGFYILVVAGLSPIFQLFAWNIGARPLFQYFTWSSWEYWAWAALLAGGPLVLLLVGVDTSRKRLKPQRHILVSAAAAGFALALLILAAVASVVEVPKGDNWGRWGDVVPWIVLASWPSAWLVWTLVFWRLGERLFDPAQRVYRWLVAGSVLELLIAVPSHVIARRRNECTAPYVTAFGVATGLAILLMSLGPGVLFLYRARMRRLSPRAESSNAPSGPE